jgi:hypothetical protein
MTDTDSLIEALEAHIVDYPTPENIAMQKKYIAELKRSEISVVEKPTEAMCDGARGFIMGLDLNCRTFGAMEKHLDLGGYDCLPYIRQKAKETPKAHITKWDVADCIWQLMQQYHPVPTPEPVSSNPVVKESFTTDQPDGLSFGEREWVDTPDEYSALITTTHPTVNGDYETHKLAMRLFENRHSKWALVDLINYLLQAPKRESGWVFVSAENGRLCNLPNDEEDVLFKYGEGFYHGYYMQDATQGEDNEEGFYSHSGTFFESEHVRCWIATSKLTTQIEVGAAHE